MPSLLPALVFAALPLRVLVPRAASPATANPLLWYVTRAAAVSAYVTLTLTVALGISRSLARVARLRVSWVLDESHQYLALLTAAFIVLHLLSLVFDPLIPFSVLDVLLPLSQPYRPIPVDLGVLALYALAIVLLSSWLRRWLAYARWRALHYVSFVAFVLVTTHGLLAGSDAGQTWMRLVYVAASLGIGGLVVMRLLAPAAPGTPPGAPAPSRGAASTRDDAPRPPTRPLA